MAENEWYERTAVTTKSPDIPLDIDPYTPYGTVLASLEQDRNLLGEMPFLPNSRALRYPELDAYCAKLGIQIEDLYAEVDLRDVFAKVPDLQAMYDVNAIAFNIQRKPLYLALLCLKAYEQTHNFVEHARSSAIQLMQGILPNEYIDVLRKQPMFFWTRGARASFLHPINVFAIGSGTRPEIDFVAFQNFDKILAGMTDSTFLSCITGLIHEAGHGYQFNKTHKLEGGRADTTIASSGDEGYADSVMEHVLDVQINSTTDDRLRALLIEIDRQHREDIALSVEYFLATVRGDAERADALEAQIRTKIPIHEIHEAHAYLDAWDMPANLRLGMHGRLTFLEQQAIPQVSPYDPYAIGHIIMENIKAKRGQEALIGTDQRPPQFGIWSNPKAAKISVTNPKILALLNALV